MAEAIPQNKTIQWREATLANRTKVSDAVHQCCTVLLSFGVGHVISRNINDIT